MFTKFFKNFKKKEKKSSNLETDSVPELPRAGAEAAAVPLGDEVNWNLPSHHSASHSAQIVSDPSRQRHFPAASVSPFPSPLFNHSVTPTIHLSISNSHGFQVGEIHNVTVSNGGVVNYNPSPSANIEKSLLNLQQKYQVPKPACDILKPSDIETITHNYDKLKDWHINLISENAVNDWKLLGRAIGLLPTEIVAVDLRAGSNASQAVHDILQTYLWRYPDTSIGFIADLLLETGQKNALEKLVKLTASS